MSPQSSQSDIGPHDVLLGRTKKAYKNEGNVKFRALLVDNIETYSSITSRLEKTLMIGLIVEEITENGGRFLRRDDYGDWIVVDDKESHRKVGYAMRDSISLLKRTGKLTLPDSTNRGKMKVLLKKKKTGPEPCLPKAKPSAKAMKTKKSKKNAFNKTMSTTSLRDLLTMVGIFPYPQHTMTESDAAHNGEHDSDLALLTTDDIHMVSSAEVRAIDLSASDEDHQQGFPDLPFFPILPNLTDTPEKAFSLHDVDMLEPQEDTFIGGDDEPDCFLADIKDVLLIEDYQQNPVQWDTSVESTIDTLRKALDHVQVEAGIKVQLDSSVKKAIDALRKALLGGDEDELIVPSSEV